VITDRKKTGISLQIRVFATTFGTTILVKQYQMKATQTKPALRVFLLSIFAVLIFAASLYILINSPA
jgi:hypothetical protein